MSTLAGAILIAAAIIWSLRKMSKELTDAVDDAISNYDFSEAISSALDDHDLTNVIEETLRGKTITIR